MKKANTKFSKKIVCFDFDGTCTTKDIFPDFAPGNVNIEVRDATQFLMILGVSVIINSCRQNIHYDDMASWLDDNGFHYTTLQLSSKPIADVYIDDKGMLPTGRISPYILSVLYFD